MNLGRTLYLTNRRAWRSWLSKNHKKEKEIWLIYPKSHTGKRRITYNDAVEEALCFGWIDSTAKKINENHFAQRFSPRKSTGNWSQPNIERLRKLIKLGKVTSAGFAAIKDLRVLLKRKKLEIASDILIALKQNKKVWKNFQSFPDDYKRIRIAYIESRRRHGQEQFQKSLNYFVKRTEKNEQFQFGFNK